MRSKPSMLMPALVLAAVVATAFTLAGCYLFNSKTLSLPPDTVEQAVNPYRFVKEPPLPFYIFYFPRELTTPSGYRVAIGGYLKAITPPKPSLTN